MNKGVMRKIVVWAASLLTVMVSFAAGSNRAYAPPIGCKVSPCRNIYFFQTALDGTPTTDAWAYAFSDGIGGYLVTLSGWIDCYNPATTNSDGKTSPQNGGYLLYWNNAAIACTVSTKTPVVREATVMGGGTPQKDTQTFYLCVK